MIAMWKAFVLTSTLLLAALAPAQHTDFRHYTFALTWQPGICSMPRGCTANQPHDVHIGLHGLWASLPASLASRGVVNRQWWSRGCDYFHHSDAAPPIPPSLRRRVLAVMPHFAHSLLVHEYDKHVQCFGFNPAAFFSTELRMRAAVAASPFGAYLRREQGGVVTRTQTIRTFETAFHTSHAASLQLQCKRNRAGRSILTQFWITISAARLDRFPAPGALIDSKIDQTSCPSAFTIPRWG